MNNLRRLRAPAGTDEANYGEQRFRVDNDGTVWVPQEAVAGLVGEGGFEEIEDAPVTPVGFARVVHADPAAVCGGTRLPDGSFVVPVSEVKELAAHGFVGVEDALKSIAVGPDPKVEVPAPAAPGPTFADLEAVRGEIVQHRTETQGMAAEIEQQKGRLAELQALHDAQTAEIEHHKGEIAELHGTLELLTAPHPTTPDVKEDHPA